MVINDWAKILDKDGQVHVDSFILDLEKAFDTLFKNFTNASCLGMALWAKLFFG